MKTALVIFICVIVFLWVEDQVSDWFPTKEEEQ